MRMVLKNKVYRGFWQVADPKIWIASTVPMLLGTLLAYKLTKHIDLFWLILSFVGIYFIEIGKNAINECMDYISGADLGVDSEHRTPFSGGKKTIVDNILTVKQSAIIGIVTIFFAGLIGILIVIFREPRILFIGLAGIFLAAAYSLPPFKLCYRGLGEIAVGLTFGPFIVNGIYVVLAKQFDILPTIVSMPIGLLIANVLWINQFPDYEADKSVGKKNWVVRLGKHKASMIYGAIFVLAYLSIIYISLFTKNWIWLIALATTPLALVAVKNCIENLNNIEKLIKSNDMTIKIYVLTGILLGIAIIFSK